MQYIHIGCKHIGYYVQYSAAKPVGKKCLVLKEQLIPQHGLLNFKLGCGFSFGLGLRWGLPPCPKWCFDTILIVMETDGGEI